MNANRVAERSLGGNLPKPPARATGARRGHRTAGRDTQRDAGPAARHRQLPARRAYVDPRLQVIASAGAASVAAIAINADLVNEDVELAVASPPTDAGAAIADTPGPPDKE